MDSYPSPGHCWSCLERHEDCTNAYGGGGPKPGDVTICLYCGEISKYDDQLLPIKPTDEEMAEYRKDDRIMRVQKAIQELRYSKKHQVQ